MIMMQAPPDLTAFCFAGAPVELRDGLVAIDERHLDVFRAHGFAPRRLTPDRAAKDGRGAQQRREEQAAKEQAP